MGSNATESEIKKAYRKKSKQYHPDVNKSPNAQEQFIELSEAYQYLIKYKGQPAPAFESREDADVQWQDEREQARERARYYAQQSYEEFRKSDLYKATQAVESIFDHLSVVITSLNLLGPLIGYFIKGLWD